MALVSLPLFAFAVRLARDARSSGRIVLGDDALSIVLPGTLRRPIEIARMHVRKAIVDPAGHANGEERLHFAVAPGRFLYSSVGGSDAPFLGADPAFPNLAIVFDKPMAFDEPRRRLTVRVESASTPSGAAVSAIANEFAPMHPLSAGCAVPGLLLRVDNPGPASVVFSHWLGTSDDSSEPTQAPAIRPALTAQALAQRRLRTWGGALFVGLFAAFGAVRGGGHGFVGAVGRAAHQGEALGLGIAGLLLSAGMVFDMRLRAEERRGLARLPSFALVATGMMVIAVTMAAGSGYS